MRKKSFLKFIRFWIYAVKMLAFGIVFGVAFMYFIGGSVATVAIGALIHPLTLAVTVPFLMYFYYVVFADKGKRWDRFLEIMENWVDGKEEPKK